MNLSFVPMADVTPAAWDHIVETSPDGWVWALSGWQRLITPVKEWGLETLSFAAMNGSTMVAVMPLHYQAAAHAVRSSGWGLVGPILSPAVADADRSTVIGLLLKEAARLARVCGATRLEVGAAPLTPASRLAPQGVSPFVVHGYHDTSTHTRILHLDQGAEALWAGVSENAKRKIRRAQKLGCVVRRESWPEMLDRYYQAHCETYTRTGVTPHPRAYFEGIARELAPLGHAVLWVGYSPSGVPVAFRNDCRFNGGVLYHTGCSMTEALDMGVNYQLVWQAVEGAIADGFRFYEIGEVHLDATDGKARSLTEFKSRFGGELHRYFKAHTVLSPLPPSTSPVSVAEPAPVPAAVKAVSRDQEAAVREAYERESIYAPSRICLKPGTGTEYTDVLLQTRMALVAKYYRGGRLLDLCCATGDHLRHLAGPGRSAVGVDFSRRYVETAAEAAREAGLANLTFVQADARQLPLAAGSIDLVYSFSSLYAVPRPVEAIEEVGRVLATGGHAVLDLGNRRSLNTLCVSYYTEWPPIYPLTLAEIRDALARASLKIVEHRRFQLLPLWAGRPPWLWPLLHPAWKRLLTRRVGGRMLDEWVSSLPLLRGFAFRHLIVCIKTAPDSARH